MSDELKPCPSCGGEGYQIEGFRYVTCRDCYVQGPVEDDDGSKWNALAQRVMDGDLARDCLGSIRGLLSTEEDMSGTPAMNYTKAIQAMLARRNRRIAELEAASEWISVGERLPGEYQTVLIAHEDYDDEPELAHVDGGVWMFSRDDIEDREDPTHWQPLPEVPR